MVLTTPQGTMIVLMFLASPQWNHNHDRIINCHTVILLFKAAFLTIGRQKVPYKTNSETQAQVKYTCPFCQQHPLHFSSFDSMITILLIGTVWQMCAVCFFLGCMCGLFSLFLSALCILLLAACYACYYTDYKYISEHVSVCVCFSLCACSWLQSECHQCRMVGSVLLLFLSFLSAINVAFLFASQLACQPISMPANQSVSQLTSWLDNQPFSQVIWQPSNH